MIHIDLMDHGHGSYSHNAAGIDGLSAEKPRSWRELQLAFGPPDCGLSDPELRLVRIKALSDRTLGIPARSAQARLLAAELRREIDAVHVLLWQGLASTKPPPGR